MGLDHLPYVIWHHNDIIYYGIESQVKIRSLHRNSMDWPIVSHNTTLAKLWDYSRVATFVLLFVTGSNSLVVTGSNSTTMCLHKFLLSKHQHNFSFSCGCSSLIITMVGVAEDQHIWPHPPMPEILLPVLHLHLMGVAKFRIYALWRRRPIHASAAQQKVTFVLAPTLFSLKNSIKNMRSLAMLWNE